MLDKNLVRLELVLGLGLGLGLVNFQLRLSILFQLQKKEYIRLMTIFISGNYLKFPFITSPFTMFIM